MEACQKANLAAKNPELQVDEQVRARQNSPRYSITTDDPAQIYGVLPKLPGCMSITTSTNNAIWASKGTCNPETGDITLPDGSIFDPNGKYEDLPDSHPPTPDQQVDKTAAKSASALAGGATTVTKRAIKTSPVEPTSFVDRRRRPHQHTKRRIV